jgi:hypothetical protein
MFSCGIDRVLYVIEEILAQPQRSPRRRRVPPRSSLPPRQEVDERRSPEPGARSGHGLITGSRRHLAPAIGVVSAAGFLEPKLVYPPFRDRIELVDEHARQRRLLLAGKRSRLFLEIVELAAHDQIIGRASCTAKQSC